MNKQLNIKMAVMAVIFSVGGILPAIAAEPVYSVDQLIADISQLAGKTITVKGKCGHVCSSSGKKIFLSNTEGRLIRFNAGDKVDRFNRAAQGKMVTITGVVTENRTYMASLDKLENRLVELEKKKAPAQHHCNTDAKANGENVSLSALERVRMQKDKLTKQIAEGGNDYLASYTVNGCNDYSFE